MSETEEAKVREIVRQPGKYFRDYQLTVERVGKSGAVYHGKPVPFLYVPKIFTGRDIGRFKAAVADMFKIINHTIELYMKEAGVRALFGFEERLEELILSAGGGHGYLANVPMGRLDIFYYGDGSYKFCELNTDGASAMNEEAELTNVLLGSLPMREAASVRKIGRFELFYSWVEEVGQIYNEFRIANHEAPLPKNSREANNGVTVAILDFKDMGNLLEFEVFKKDFEKAGFKCLILEPRDLICSDGKLFYHGRRIDIIYRRLVTKDLLDRYDEAPELIRGILANQTCIIGPVKSQIVHTKRFFEVLYQPAFRAFLSAEEIAYIDGHVPLTKPLKDDESLNGFICNKDRYIIKPVDGYASSGVCAGGDFTREEWEALLREKAGENYIIQEYCPLSLSENVIYDDKGVAQLCEFRNLTGLFVYNQKFAGVYSRAGRNAIISGQHDGYTMSSVYTD